MRKTWTSRSKLRWSSDFVRSVFKFKSVLPTVRKCQVAWNVDSDGYHHCLACLCTALQHADSIVRK